MADEYAVSDFSEYERLQYGQALLEMAAPQAQGTVYVKALGLSAKYIYRGRIMQLKTTVKRHMSKIRAAAVSLLLMAAFTVSMFPVLAYAKIPVIIFETDANYEDFAGGALTDMGFSEGIPADNRFLQGDSFFTDKNGNVYYEAVRSQTACTSFAHDFAEGTYTTHERLEDGGCTVSVYEAERCARCGTPKNGGLISTTQYVACIH